MKGRRPVLEPQDSLAKEIVGLAMKVHRRLDSGFSETVYRNSLIVELRRAEIAFECHPKVSVMYEGEEVGIFQPDLVIEQKLIVELKVAETIADEHCAQLVNYLTATRIEHGLLLNFGTTSLTFRTKDRIYQPPPQDSIDIRLY